MHPFWRRTALVLLFALFAGFWSPPRARAADEGGAGNLTLGIVALVAVVAVVMAWKMDFGADDDILASTRSLSLQPADDDRVDLVLTDWQTSDNESGEMVSGVALRAWF